nr:hypothetical protein Q903MT_gene6489 [Picea sitchensis]
MWWGYVGWLRGGLCPACRVVLCRVEFLCRGSRAALYISPRIGTFYFNSYWDVREMKV